MIDTPADKNNIQFFDILDDMGIIDLLLILITN